MAKKRVFSNVPFAVRNRPDLRRPDGGTGRPMTGSIPSERAVGRTAAGVGAAEPGGTPEPGTARGPNHVDCDHRCRRSGANGVNPARPSKVTNSDSAAVAEPADGTGH